VRLILRIFQPHVNLCKDVMNKYIVDSPKAKLLAIKLGWNFYSPKNNKCISHGVRQKLDECEVILISERNLNAVE
jgi:hypothetical protein